MFDLPPCQQTYNHDKTNTLLPTLLLKKILATPPFPLQRHPYLRMVPQRFVYGLFWGHTWQYTGITPDCGLRNHPCQTRGTLWNAWDWIQISPLCYRFSPGPQLWLLYSSLQERAIAESCWGRKMNSPGPQSLPLDLNQSDWSRFLQVSPTKHLYSRTESRSVSLLSRERSIPIVKIQYSLGKSANADSWVFENLSFQ